MSLDIGVGIYLGLEKPLLSGLGPELVVNGQFNGVSPWIEGNWTIAGGVATALVGLSGELRQDGIIALNTTYRTVFDILTIDGTGTMRIEIGAIVGTDRSVPGRYTEVITSGPSLNNLRFLQPTEFGGSIDNVSVREVL